MGRIVLIGLIGLIGLIVLIGLHWPALAGLGLGFGALEGDEEAVHFRIETNRIENGE